MSLWWCRCPCPAQAAHRPGRGSSVGCLILKLLALKMVHSVFPEEKVFTLDSFNLKMKVVLWVRMSYHKSNTYL